MDADDIDYHQAIQYYKSNHQELYHRPGPVYTIPEGDEKTEVKGDRKMKPEMFKRGPLHSAAIPPFLPDDILQKRHGK